MTADPAAGCSVVATRDKATARLLDTGGARKDDRITHRIPVTSMADVDAEVKKWMRAAYEADA